MSTQDPDAKSPSKESKALEGSVESWSAADDGVDVVVHLRNPSDRALHYISDVRGIRVDPATGGLQVFLSDSEFITPLASFPMEPQFRLIDPNSDATLAVKLPKTMVRMADPAPDGSLRFDERVVADAPTIALIIGWSDTPLYRDPRDGSRQETPFAAWEQDRLRVSFEPAGKTRRARRPSKG